VIISGTYLLPEVTFPNAMVGGVQGLVHSEIQKGAFCTWCVAFAPDVVSHSAKDLGMLIKSSQKIGKKRKKIISLIKHANTTIFAQRSLMPLLKLCKNEGNVYVRKMLSGSRKKIIDQNRTRLRHAIRLSSFAVARKEYRRNKMAV